MNTETTHPIPDAGKNQCEKLESYFRAHPNEWLDAPELAREMTGGTGAGTTPCRRIHELRHERGMNIEHKRNMHTENGQQAYGSYYRFLPVAPEIKAERDKNETNGTTPQEDAAFNFAITLAAIL